MPWRISQFPELDHLAVDERRRTLKAIPLWTYPYMIGSAAIFAAIPCFIASMVIGELAHLTSESIGILFFGGSILLAIYLYSVQLCTVRRHLRREVAKQFRGECPPFCFTCGYDLRNVAADRCPECGRELFKIG